MEILYPEGLKPGQGLNCVQALGVALHRSEVAQVVQPKVCTEQPMVAPPTRFASEGAIRGKGSGVKA